MKIQKLAFFGFATLIGLGLSAAQTTIIGGNVRNGNFDADTSTNDSRPYADTPFWENFAGSQAAECTRLGPAGTDFNGTRNLVLSASDTVVAYQNTGHILSEGELIEVSCVWRDAFNWGPGDQLNIRVFTTDDDTPTGTATAFGDWTATEALNNTYEIFEASTVVPATAAGKNLFVIIDSIDDGSGFARVDNMVVTATADPNLVIDAGDFAFGDLLHPAPTDSTTRTVTFSNAGASNSLTVNSISLTHDAGGIFSITDAPADNTTIAPGESFDVEITATGGGGYTSYVGEVSIDTNVDTQDLLLPVTATIATSGDPVRVVGNPDFDSGASGWTGSSIETSGLKSTNGVRVPGAGDDRSDPSINFAANLAQSFSITNSPDFTSTVCFAIPDTDFTNFTPDGSLFDSAFHLAILGSTTLPDGNVYDDADAANTIIDLYYLPDGITTGGDEGFYLYDGTSGFTHLAGLGTILPSTGYNASGDPPSLLNTYQLVIEATDFGTGSASYSISISDANLTNVAATVSGLTSFRGTDPTTTTAKAIVLTTADASTDSTVSGTQQSTFWVDRVSVELSTTLPAPLIDVASKPYIVKMLENESRSTFFTIGNIGIGGDLDVTGAAFGDPRFSLVSPSLPVAIAPGETQEFEVLVDFSAETGEQNISSTVTLTTNAPFESSPLLDLEGQILPTGARLLVDFDDGVANGIHETSIRNGGFEDGVAGDDFLTTPVWATAFSPEGDTVTCTLNTTPASGLIHGQASGFSGAGERAQPAQNLTFSEWTLGEGDTFDIQLDWRDGDGFIEGGLMQIIVEVFDDDGNLVPDPVNSPDPVNNGRLISQSFTLDALGSYQTTSVTTAPVAAGSPWIGKRIRVRFLKNGTRTTFIDIDNVSITGRIPTSFDDFKVTSVDFDPLTNNVTIRWTDAAIGTYRIESSPNLDFGPGVVTYDLDGSEDTTTYPGEIEFTFNDPTATGDFHSWRVITE